MSLQEEIEKDRKALAALTEESENGEENQELVEDVSEVDEPEAEKPDESAEKVEEKTKTEEKAPEKEEPKLDDAGYRRLRREKEAAERRAKELEEQLKAPKEEIAQEDAVNQEILEVIKAKRIHDAEMEFVRLESDFSRDKPDFEEVSQAYKTAIYQSQRVQNPRASHAELLDMTKNTILHKASAYVNKGLNPIEEMYDEALSLGLKPSKKEPEAVEEKEEVKKPSLATIAANKARNAGTASAKGRGSAGTLTPALAADMTSAEWMALPKAERARILGGG